MILKKIIFLLTFLIYPWEVNGYIGPGAGLTAIGTVIAITLLFFAIIIAFLWYPIKRIFRKILRKK